ncbi:MAG: efflux RND transporter periplasmic adaptor subunit [Phycisphaerae bacterium]
MSNLSEKPTGFMAKWGFGFAALLILGGATVAVRFGHTRGAARGKGLASTKATFIPNVVTVTARPASAARAITLPATVRAFYKVRIYAMASGYLKKINVDIGDHVKAGQVLAVISEPELHEEYIAAIAKTNAAQATVATARAAVVHARKKLLVARSALAIAQANQALQKSIFTRDKHLYQGGDLSTQAFEQIAEKYLEAGADVKGAVATEAARQAKVAQAISQEKLASANVQVAQAEVGQLAAALSYDTVTAPFTGIVANRFVDPGAFIQPARGKNGTPLLTLVSTGRMRVIAQVPQADAPYVAVGTIVYITPYGFPNEIIPGEITRTAGSLHGSSRTMTCEADIANTNPSLLYSGMYANMKIIERRLHVITLPTSVVMTGPSGGNPFVYVVRGGIVKSKPVVIGWGTGELTAIVGGLHSGDQVIVQGQDTVNPGDRVRVLARFRTYRAHRLKPRNREKTT